MRIVIWIFRILLFFILFGFAVKNDQLVQLKFFFDAQWHMPLVFVILLAFAIGAVVGVTVTLASLLSKRREIARLRRDAERTRREQARQQGGEVGKVG